MTDEETRTTITDFIGRPDTPQTDLPDVDRTEPQLSRGVAMWLVLATHLRGLEQAGVVDERSAATLASAVGRIAGQGKGDASFRAIAQSLEARVDSALPDVLRGAITLGLAHEEWIGTAVRLISRAGALTVLDTSGQAQRAMLAMAELHAVSLMQGFHSGRPVQPVSFGHFLGGAIGPVGEGVARLLDAFDRLNRSPLGAGSMSGEVVGPEREESAGWLAFSGPIPNTHDAVANVEDVIGLVEAIVSVTAPLARLLDELAVMVRTDPSSLVFDDAWMRSADQHLPGFSPVERLAMVAQQLRSVTASSMALATQVRQLPYDPIGSANDWIASDVVAISGLATREIASVDELFRSAMTVNRAYLANRAGRDFTTSNDLAAFLMTEEQLPPSVARDIAGLTVRRLHEENLQISGILPDHVDMAAMMVIGRELKVEMETLGRWLAPRRFLERRQAEGSPAPARTREWIELERETNRKMIDGIASRRLRIREAESDVKQWITDTASSEND